MEGFEYILETILGAGVGTTDGANDGSKVVGLNVGEVGADEGVMVG